MGAIYTELTELLITPPGNLAFHIILAFAVAGALQAAFSLWRDSEFPQGRRMVFGLALILVGRLALFLMAGLGSQGLVNEHQLLPIIDRAVTAWGLILIIWLWAFPEPQRSADAATTLLILLNLTGLALSLVWWQDNQADTYFNQTWLDAGWEIFSLAILGLGWLVLLLRRPNGYGFGLTMLLFATLGHALHLALPAADSDFPGLVRLAQLASYPWLLALPQRFR
ncbi:MAG: hypothetical protein JW862_19835, partial [Anaerolineales bacterium]|nr:hypothetical protein [Anaerolineales bacterium]